MIDIYNATMERVSGWIPSLQRGTTMVEAILLRTSCEEKSPKFTPERQSSNIPLGCGRF